MEPTPTDPEPGEPGEPAAPHLLVTVGGRGDLALRTLGVRTLLAHALDALAGWGERSGPVLVGVDAADHDRVADLVADHATGLGVPAAVLVGDAWWRAVRADPHRGLLVHDPLCPLVSRELVAEVLDRGAGAPGTAVVAHRPVTDTLKAVDGDRVVATVDRERLVSVTAPVLVPARVLRAAAQDDAPPPVGDGAALVRWLRARCEVALVLAPPLARRVEHPGALTVLEALSGLVGPAGAPAHPRVGP